MWEKYASIITFQNFLCYACFLNINQFYCYLANLSFISSFANIRLNKVKFSFCRQDHGNVEKIWIEHEVLNEGQVCYHCFNFIIFLEVRFILYLNSY